jgi:hypothetical protein
MGDDVRRKLPDELVDELLAGASSEEKIVGPGGLLGQLTKRLMTEPDTPTRWIQAKHPVRGATSAAPARVRPEACEPLDGPARCVERSRFGHR